MNAIHCIPRRNFKGVKDKNVNFQTKTTKNESKYVIFANLGLGESCLVLGFSENIPIHAVLGWRGEKVAIITVYVPKPPKFIDPWSMRKKDDHKM